MIKVRSKTFHFNVYQKCKRLKKICINRVMPVIEWSSWENEEKNEI